MKLGDGKQANNRQVGRWASVIWVYQRILCVPCPSSLPLLPHGICRRAPPAQPTCWRIWREGQGGQILIRSKRPIRVFILEPTYTKGILGWYLIHTRMAGTRMP